MDNQIFNGYFEEIEPYNSTFKKCKIKVFAFSKNRNNSNITTESFEIAKPSIYNIPIVAKFNPDVTDAHGLTGDLEGHNASVKKDKDGNWVFYQDTMPLGLVPESANIYFEDINEGTEELSDIKTYVVAEGCLLWTRYESAQKIEEWLKNNVVPKVSMEIGNVEGKFVDNVFRIDSFQFEAIAALGSELTPCFPMAQIEEYTNLDFQKAYKEMLKDFKESIQSVQGGDSVPTDDNIIDPAVVVDPTPAQFALTNEQLRKEIKIALSQDKIKDDWGWEYSRYWYVDSDDISVVAYDYSDNDRLVSFAYTTNADAITIDFATRKRMKVQYVPMEDGEESNFSLLPVEVAEYQASLKVKEAEKQFTEEKQTLIAQIEENKSAFTVVEQELSTLREYRQQKETDARLAAEAEVFAEFTNQLMEDEMATIKANASQMSIADVRKELLALAGEKLMKQFSLNTSKENKPLRIPLDNQQKQEEKPYGGRFEKYAQK